MAEHFYVRIRGRVQGPFDLDKLRQMIRRGQLSRIHEVSADGNYWQKASAYPQWFSRDSFAAEETNLNLSEADDLALQPLTPLPMQSAPAATGHRPQPHQQAAARQTATVAKANEQPAVWYYAVGDAEYGPVSFETLRALAADGTIVAESLVWREGMNTWAAASSISGLIGRSEAPRAEAARHAVGRTEVARTLADSRAWVLFIGVTLLFFAAVQTLGGILLLVQGSRFSLPPLVATGISLFFYAAVVTVLGMLLIQHVQGINRYLASFGERDLDAAFRALKRFWIFLGIILIFVLVNLVIVGIWVFSILATLERPDFEHFL